MPRHARLLVEGGCYHVLTRGNNRATVFHDRDDFQRYARLLHAYFTEHLIRLYHYCFMSNHVHLIVDVPQVRVLSKAMHGLNLSYALAYRRRYGHTGHFWQDRFKSLLIARDTYLLQCGAYVELNPVRAKMVATPEAYPWSSYRCYAEGQADPLVTCSPAYLAFGATPQQRQRRYQQFVETHLIPLPSTWLQQPTLGPTEQFTAIPTLTGLLQPHRPRGRPRKGDAALAKT